MHHWQQRKFTPKFPQKYHGDPTQIFMRSSWETHVAIWLDNNPAVLGWGSETIVIPYINPLDNRIHRYFVDFWAQIKNQEGISHTYIIEIKPYYQSIPPVITKHKRKKTILEEQATFLINQAKWEAAKKYAAKRGWKFIVLTEKELGE